MATQVKLPGTGASSTVYYGGDFVPPQGYVAWASPSNVTADDGVLTTATFATAASTQQATQNLLANNFGFTIPDGAQIDGVSIVIEESTTGTYGAFTDHVRMVVGGVITAQNKETGGPSFTGTPTYGGATDTWGNTLASSDINASNFGFVVAAGPLVIAGAQQACTASVDRITVTVSYTLIVPGVSTQSFTAVSSTRATGNGTVTGLGGSTVDKVGIVYGHSPVAATPGNVAPGSSGYELYSESSGTFSLGAFTKNISGMSTSTKYYARAYAHNSTGYSYGAEVTVFTLNATVSVFTSYDPTDIVKALIDFYSPLGGSGSYTGPSMQLTGLSLTYTFNTNTVLEGILACLRLAPDGWYFTIDIATGVITFKNASTTADYTLVRGKHIAHLDLISSIEDIKNRVYFSGGEITPGVNLYTVYSDPVSIATYGQRIIRQSDNRVTVQSTADAIGGSELVTAANEQYYTTVEILDQTMDITLFKPGQTVNFAGFNSFVDGLLLQIVRIEYTPDKVTLQLGTLPPQLSLDINQLKRGLIAEQTVANPASPS